MLRKLENSFVKFLVVLAVTAPLLSPLEIRSQTLNIATGGAAGAYYPMGTAIASVLQKSFSGTTISAQITAGSVENLNLLAAGRFSLGFALADSALEAKLGVGKFSGRKIDIYTLAVMNPMRTHVITLDGLGVRQMTDLKGKRVSIGSPGSITETIALRLIEATGLDSARDLRVERLGVAESINALRSRAIDIFFWVGSVPTQSITELANNMGAKLLFIDHSTQVESINKRNGTLYFRDKIPKNSYKGMGKDSDVLSISNLLLATPRLNEQQAYAIAKSIFENRCELMDSHSEFATLSIANQRNTATPIQFHPGVQRLINEFSSGKKTEASCEQFLTQKAQARSAAPIIEINTDGAALGSCGALLHTFFLRSEYNSMVDLDRAKRGMDRAEMLSKSKPNGFIEAYGRVMNRFNTGQVTPAGVTLALQQCTKLGLY